MVKAEGSLAQMVRMHLNLGGHLLCSALQHYYLPFTKVCGNFLIIDVATIQRLSVNFSTS